jgi:3-deoxy-D-manno-octulosonate 8-phosphate phosphatase (KDO 8-P phosphatase)
MINEGQRHCWWMIRFPRMPRLSLQARARRIQLLLFDVDGVLTDGKLYFLPTSTIPDSAGKIEFKGFHAHDGIGISLARIGGLKTGLITKRVSDNVALRARDLKLDFVHQGVNEKRACFLEVVANAGLRPEQAVYVGDDIVDLPPMRAAGLAIAVKNARAEVKREAHYVTPHAGGDGALRDAVEFILKAQGKWKRVLHEYIGG